MMKNDSNNNSVENITDDINDKSIEVIDKVIQLLTQKKKEKIHNMRRLDEFCEEYLQFIKSNHSQKYYESVKLTCKHMQDYFAKDKRIAEIKIKDAEAFVIYIREKAPRGYLVYFRNIKAAFSKAIEWEYINDNIFKKIRVRKQQHEYPAYLSKEALNQILQFFKNDVLYNIYQFAFFTGCRLSEVVHLRWKNIDLKENIVTVGDNHFRTKSRKQREIPLNSMLNKSLSAIVESKSVKQDDFVFAKSNGFTYSTTYVSKAFKKVCRLLKIDEKIHFHSLRHSFASNLVNEGLDNIAILKELLGHSSITTTMVYTHVNMSAKRKAVEMLNAT